MTRLLDRRPQSIGWLAFIVALVLLLPDFLGRDWDSIGTNTAIFAMIAIGLDIMWGLAGQVSLGQQGFMLVGAYSVAVATTKWDFPVLTTLPVAILLTAVLAFVVGLVVLRLQPTYLSLATLGLGLMLPTLVLASEYTGKATGIYGIPALPGDLDATQMYRLYWAVTIVIVIFGLRVRHSLTGLSWRVIAHNEDLARSCGVNTVIEKLKAFTIGASIAGLAGGFYAIKITAVSPQAFSLDILLIALVGVVVGGLGSMVGAVIGVIGVSIALLYAGKSGAWTNFIFAGIFVVVLKVLPGGIIPSVGRWWRLAVAKFRRAGSGARTTETAPTATAPTEAAPADATPAAAATNGGIVATVVPPHRVLDESVLVVEGVSKRFGGVAALDHVGLVVHRGEIHGIVGPNGAGKSTLLAIISGLFPPDDGTVKWMDRDISGLSSWRRARLGIARSFQAAQVVPDLTVRENVTLGLYIDTRRGLTRDVFGPQRSRSAKSDVVVNEALERFGLLPFAEAECANLSFGQLRLTELARCFVRRPTLLLLDEAAAGLDRVDKALLVDQVTKLAAEGTTVCLIEHDTDLVSRVCDHVTVLDAGTVLSRGTGREIFHDADVRASYMGKRAHHAPASSPATAGALDV